ncbi:MULTISPECIES: 30S ribosomal protein S9 [Borrelia]|uniref:Small ribosomal subunit protein uS9 n=2 Tax=Borrelia turicatae TaxID=142 RepID=RS9_BORT9|nr:MULTISPECIES: 30S ribosomal protein S9 [Borrelia]A1QZD0.1 RecName: Full=Small ribosomal subunit protein uS9; AltName: Full=30S ribosomal protein S9 [Borrelia turicatae 91E135]AAX17672.1 SSU ribosomal protein S9P [Borrelia turicatae 91E135]ANF33823.1 30S ribosomal protein S9 [Borrelia turicatae]UPA12018.1 30S ribosomal protein S9 [Borrelia venezuelensis]UPA13190.1 30S ribosomal protein S9 [Borrelia turicatae 91E135]UPA14675.1 30S ribosomal protein S9 [Borrelia turicatae]
MAKSDVKGINLGMGTGRRKSSVARVYIREGKGDIKINNRDFDSYIQLENLKTIALSPLVLTNTLGKYDLYINIYGGGISGQAGAIRHGIARALFDLDEEYKMVLKSNGFLTRDSRKVERKKFGKKKARKSFQFSKR